MTDRYDISNNPEAIYQPGSHNSVLLNKLDIADVELMEQAEFDALAYFQVSLFDELEFDQTLSVADLCAWHNRWLGDIYEWAGQYRTVNMAKGDFMFAAANLISKLMDDYDKNYLSKYTPCDQINTESLAEALALCHVEFIIIHPFREGNGRLGRLLVTAMALQAGMPPLDFALLESDKDQYITAIHAGHAGDYAPMTQIFSKILQFTLEQASE